MRHIDPEVSEMILLSSSCHHRQKHVTQGAYRMNSYSFVSCLLCTLLVILVRRDIVVLTQIPYATLHDTKATTQPETATP